MGEPKRLTAEERIYAGQLFGRVVETAADDPLDIAERLGRALLDHIAAQEAEIARLETELQAAGARENALRTALEGANWIIEQLKGHEATAILIRGWVVPPEDIQKGAKCRQLIDAALATPPSVYAQRAQKMAAVVEAARELVGYWQTHEIEPMIHRLDDALAALDDVEVGE